MKKTTTIILLLLLIALEVRPQATMHRKFVNNAAGRLTAVVYNNGKTVEFKFDKTGNRLWRRVSLGNSSLMAQLYGSVVSAGQVWHKPTGQTAYQLKGATDANGYLKLEFADLQQGDTLMFAAPGYKPLFLPVDADFRFTNRTVLPMIAEKNSVQTSGIVNPYFYAENNHLLSSTSEVKIHYGALNATDVLVWQNDAYVAVSENPFTYTLAENENQIKLKFKNEASEKTLEHNMRYFNPEVFADSSYTVSLRGNEALAGANMYQDSLFLGKVANAHSTIYTLARKNSALRFVKLGYFDAHATVSSDTVLEVNLYPNQLSTVEKTLEFKAGQSLNYEDMTLWNPSVGDVVLRKSYNQRDSMGFRYVSPLYSIERESFIADDTLRFAALTNLPEKIKTDEVYLAINDGTGWQKVFPDDAIFSSFVLDENIQMIKYDSITTKKLSFGFVKRRPAETKDLFITGFTGNTKIPLTDIVSWPDSLLDGTISVKSTSTTAVSATISNDTLTVDAPTLSGKAEIILLAENDRIQSEAKVSVSKSYFPIVSDFEKTVNEDDTLRFITTDFLDNFHSDNGGLDSVCIVTLPANAKLLLDDKDVVSGQIFPADSASFLEFAPDPDWNGATQFAYSARDVNGWAETDAYISITVNPMNENVVINQQLAGKQLCYGDTHTFTVAASGGGLEYQYFLNDAELPGAITADYEIAFAKTENAGRMFVKIYNDVDTAFTDTVDVIVNLIDDFTITSEDTTCQYAELAFETDQKDYSGTWSSASASLVQSESTTATFSFPAHGDVTITHTRADDNTGCTLTRSKDVYVYQAPDMSINLQSPVCASELLHVVHTTQEDTVSYSWTATNAGIFSGFDNDTALIAYNTTGIAEIYLTGINDTSLCSYTIKKQVNVIGAISLSTAPTGNQKLCVTETADYTLSPVLGAQYYEFELSNGSYGMLHTNQNITTFYPSDDISGKHTVGVRGRVVSICGQTTNWSSYTNIILEAPYAPENPEIQTAFLCQGSSTEVLFNKNSDMDSCYVVFEPQEAGVIEETEDGKTILNLNPDYVGIVSLQTKAYFAICDTYSTSQKTEIEVKPNPVGITGIEAEQEICISNTSVLTAQNWNSNEQLQLSVNSIDGVSESRILENKAYIDWAKGGQYTLSLQTRTICGLSEPQTIDIQVFEKAELPEVVELNDSLKLQGENIASVRWFHESLEMITTTGSAIPIKGCGQYAYKVTDKLGCQSNLGVYIVSCEQYIHINALTFNNLYITISHSFENVEFIEVYNPSGKLEIRKELNEQNRGFYNLPLSNLDYGLFIVNIKVDGKTHQAKFLKL